MSNSFSSIDPTTLNSVTGGKTVKGTSASSSSSNEALVNQLSGLQSSLKDLSSQKPQSTLGNTNTMLLFCALAASRPQQTNVVYVRRGRW